MDASEINLSCSSCRWLWSELEGLRTTVEQIHKQVAELQQQNTKLQAEIDRLKKERRGGWGRSEVVPPERCTADILFALAR